ncbi:class E vacuolar protein-sorting machinery protein HSE1-like [Rhagoletis pomonella]|uniref:class E vacuolar protein-sorting machinery protein HSE1-like n=1 Tax=Rhagoletis pomonella TaxID=28610 RepID=UPI00177FDF6D|nr:class E vacuolar protein-sorting machinery protein HSE1-like [Rhagoletis pomonella]
MQSIFQFVMLLLAAVVLLSGHTLAQQHGGGNPGAPGAPPGGPGAPGNPGAKHFG